MRKLNICLLLLISNTIILSSCNKDDDGDDYAMTSQEFVMNASSSNKLEIMAGQLAVQQGVRQSVKVFGQHMVEEHTATGMELSSLASAKGLTISANLMQHHQSNLAILSPLTGQSFDRAFAELMVISHQEAVRLFAIAADEEGVADVEIRAWAAAKLPDLQQHLDEAEDLYVEVNATAGGI